MEFLAKFLSQFRNLKSSDPTNETWAKDKSVWEEVSKELKGLEVRFRKPGKCRLLVFSNLCLLATIG